MRVRTISRDLEAGGAAIDPEIRSLIRSRRFWRNAGICASLCLVFYAVPGLPFLWAFFLLSPISFTFTDPPDYIFISLIVLTLTALAVRHRRSPPPPGWVKAASAAAMILAVLAPLVPLVALYLLADYAQEMLGHRPRVVWDDPQRIGRDDPTYQMLRACVIYGSCFSSWCLSTWGTLLVHLRRHLSTRMMLWQIGIFPLGWLPFLVEPSNYYLVWWLD